MNALMVGKQEYWHYLAFFPPSGGVSEIRTTVTYHSRIIHSDFITGSFPLQASQPIKIHHFTAIYHNPALEILPLSSPFTYHFFASLNYDFPSCFHILFPGTMDDITPYSNARGRLQNKGFYQYSPTLPHVDISHPVSTPTRTKTLSLTFIWSLPTIVCETHCLNFFQ